jgi:hypothetical protein
MSFLRRFFLITLLLIFAVTMMFGCTKKEPQPADKPAETVELPSKIMTVGSQAPGSLYVTYCAAWSQILMKRFDGLQVDVLPGGSSQNIVMVSNGEVDFGITSSSQAYFGWKGTEWAKGTKYQNIRSIVPAYPAILAFFSLEKSGIDSIQKWNDKVVCLGPSGSGSDTIGRQLIDLFDLNPKKIVNAAWDDAGNMLRDGLVDAICYIAGHPVGFAQELEVNHRLNVYSLNKEERDRLQEAHPYYPTYKIKEGTYKTLEEDLETVTIFNFLICKKDLPEEFIYHAVKSTFENVDILIQAHSMFDETKPENAYYINIPLHPGAERYYKEMGISLPQTLTPDN